MFEFIKRNFGYLLGVVFVPFIYPFVSRMIDGFFKIDNKNNKRPYDNKQNK